MSCGIVCGMRECSESPSPLSTHCRLADGGVRYPVHSIFNPGQEE